MMKWLRLAGFLVTVLLCLSLEAWADWSAEILLWEPPADANVGPYEAVLATDARGGMHVVYETHFRVTGSPYNPRTGIVYRRFDDHGNCTAGPVMLNDSTDMTAQLFQIRLFGTDSLIVMWGGDHRHLSRTLDLQGSILSLTRVWTQNVGTEIYLTYAFDTRPDGHMVFAYSDFDSLIRVISVLPSGERPLDRTIVWNTPADRVDCVAGFLDATDSLQLVWRQRSVAGDWDAVYAKRVAIGTPFEIMHLNDHVALTPETPGLYSGPQEMQPFSDSLLLYIGTDPQPGVSDFYLYTLRRRDYSLISSALVGQPPFAALEGDSVVSYCAWMQDGLTHLRRCRLPSLELIQDTVLISGRSYEAAPEAYGVSAQGVRHIVYARSDAEHVVRYYYRYWRADLGVKETPHRQDEPVFTLSPNPTNGAVILTGPVKDLLSVELYNLLGQRLWKQRMDRANSGTTARINLASFPSGIYFVRANTLSTSSFHKVCIVR